VAFAVWRDWQSARQNHDWKRRHGSDGGDIGWGVDGSDDGGDGGGD
jgi:hypothetical protein